MDESSELMDRSMQQLVCDAIVWDGRYRTPYPTRSQWKTMRVFSAEQSPVTSVTLFQLRPNTFYELMVLARNRIGDALFSETVSVRTKGTRVL